MKIAIVEDSQEEASFLSQKIKSYMESNALSFELFFYPQGELFIEALTSLSFDIVFMDIYLLGMNGMKTAGILRRRDRNCKLIFLTSSDEYIRQGYSVDASHYLIKPVNDEEFAEAMNNCRVLSQYAVPTLDIYSKGSLFQLDTGIITYINIENRTVWVHSEFQSLAATGTFSKITAPLSEDPRFLLVIRGILLNMDYISHQEGSCFILRNNEKIPINLRNKKRIIQAYRDYVFRQLGGF